MNSKTSGLQLGPSASVKGVPDRIVYCAYPSPATAGITIGSQGGRRARADWLLLAPYQAPERYVFDLTFGWTLLQVA